MTLYEGIEFVELERRGHILIATLNRPEKLNAVRRRDHEDLTQLLRDVERDDECRVLVVRGKGRAFSVGGDLSLVDESTADPSVVLRNMREARDMVAAHLDLQKPVVAAIHGRVSGAGASFGLLCDITVVERGTKIADGHTRFGMVAGDGPSVLLWPLAVGIVRAKRWMLSGEWIDAEEAYEVGLVTELVDEGRAFDRAMEWAEDLAARAPYAVQLTKRALNGWYQIARNTFETSLAYEMLSLTQPETRHIVEENLFPKRDDGPPSPA